MTLAQCQLLISLYLHGSYNVITAAATARVCARMGWVDLSYNNCKLTAEGMTELKRQMPELITLHERVQAYQRKEIDALNRASNLE